MSTEIKRRGGTTAEHSAFTGVLRELTVDTDKKTVVVHDGSTVGGTPLAKSAHTHTADEIFGGSGITLSVSSGGTGASTAVDALSNLGGAPILNETEYVSSQSAFALAYSGSSKTILLGANTYTMPGTFIPTINLVHQGSSDDVKLVGNMNAAVSGASALITTIWQNLTVDGNVNVSNPFDTTLELNSCKHISGAMNISASTVQGEVRYVLGSVEQFNIAAINLKMLGTRITGVGSTNSGGDLRLLSITAELDASTDIYTQTDGTCIIQDMRWDNPSGRGITLSGGEATIDGYIRSGPGTFDGLVFTGSAILNLGIHNLPDSELIDGGGTLVPLRKPVEASSIDSTEILQNAVIQSKIANGVVSPGKLEDRLREFHQEVIIPVVTASGPGATNEVIWGYVKRYRFMTSIRMQTLASTAVTADVQINRHEIRVAGEGFPASTLTLASGISVGGLLASNTIVGGSVADGHALSLDFTNFSGGSVLNNLMVNMTFRI